MDLSMKTYSNRDFPPSDYIDLTEENDEENDEEIREGDPSEPPEVIEIMDENTNENDWEQDDPDAADTLEDPPESDQESFPPYYNFDYVRCASGEFTFPFCKIHINDVWVECGPWGQRLISVKTYKNQNNNEK